MVYSCHSKAVDGPAILQLRKWDSPLLNLSEFCEAFISPTRALLLLLSRHYEASLLPVVTGNKTNTVDDPNYSKCLQCSSSFSSSKSAVPSVPDSLDNVPNTSGTVEIASDSSSCESTSTSYSHYSITDVKSLAWGHFGDAYNQHEDAVFRELLFVSGNHGVTVHAFSHLDRSTRNASPLPEHPVGQGGWVEWGPETVHSVYPVDQSSLYSKVTGNLRQVNRTTQIEASSQDVTRGRDDESSKKWLKTFHTKVDTIELEGNIWTKFPEDASYPRCAEVVSFSVLDNIPKLLEFLSRSDLSNIKENGKAKKVPQESVDGTSVDFISSSLNSVVSSEKMHKVWNQETSSSVKCSRVFSSSSHRLVGFVLILVDPMLVNNAEENVRNANQVFVLVTMIYQGGLRWISSMKLQDVNLNPALEFDWADFQFSDNLLACLHTSGLIFVYDATTGVLLQRVDVLHVCGLNLNANSPNQGNASVEDESMLSADGLLNQDNIHHETTHETKDHMCTKRIFKKLIVASTSSFLAAIDECGVTYTILPGDYISDENSTNKLLPHLRNFGIGMLIGWEVGGLEIGCQKALSGLPKGHSFNGSSVPNSNISEKQNWFFHGKQGKFGSYLSGFVATSQKKQGVHRSETSLKPLRRILLPVDGGSKDNTICFSPLGITRLVKTCNLNNEKGFKLYHTHLRISSKVHDDRGVSSQFTRTFDEERNFTGEAVGCSFQGCLYLVTQDGLSVVLPAVSISSYVLPVEFRGLWRPSFSAGSGYQFENLLMTKESTVHWPLWKLEILDRALLYEGPEAADHMCSENGWELKIARLRRLQLALDYLKVDEIEQSLEMLVEVNSAEEGVLRILFTAVYQVFCKAGNDNEVALASRLLALAASFAIRMIGKYGLLKREKDIFMFQMIGDSRTNSSLPTSSDEESSEMSYCKKLHEMAHFLEVIRIMQCRLNVKCRKPAQGSVDDSDTLIIVDTKLLENDASADSQKQSELALPASGSNFEGTEKLALVPAEFLQPSTHLDSRNSSVISILSPEDYGRGKNMIPFENPKDMMTRWEINNLDLKTVVKDALRSGRLPLAVLQLHIQRVRDLVSERKNDDIFSDIRDVGKTISYDLFLKGETRLAIETLQRLGEDIEVSLKQLLFGTVRRSLRMQIAEEMQRFGYLAPYERKILERISLIERLYPSSSFWGSFHGQQKKLNKVSSSLTSPDDDKLQLVCSPFLMDCIIDCGEIDGAVIGPWASIDETSVYGVVEDDTMHFGYWAAAAVWSDAWDQRTVDRIVLDQPSVMGVHVSWESQTEYYMCHNDWEEVSKLLEMIPLSLLSNGSLQVNLDGLDSSAVVGCNRPYLGNEKYTCSVDELDSVCMDIPNIKVLKFTSSNMCTMWLRKLMEQELAKKFIFMKEYFECTEEIIPLLFNADFIANKSKVSMSDESSKNLPALASSNLDGAFHKDTVEAFHKLFIHHCAQYDLPHLLDLYLDHHELVQNSDSLSSLVEAAGGSEWAKWLLLSRVKGHEYEASFSNARSIISHNTISDEAHRVLEIDEIIRTVDDMAEGSGEMAALATLLHAPAPVQKCLCSGSVNRHLSSSAQCTLENLRSALQHFPTLWRTLVATCFGQDVNESSFGPNARNVFGNSALSDYLNWRENIFTSAGRDTSLEQMLPCWFSKPIRRLIQLYVQGPFGWQSLAGISTGEYFLHKDMDIFISTHEKTGVSAISWEAAIQKKVEEELYASALEEAKYGVEHHLHRGRALAAFNHLLGLRIKMLGTTHHKQSSASVHGKANIQADVQMLLGPVTQSEESLLSAVMPLAIVNFEDSVLVASCAFLLELCSISAGMLRVDIAALRRISSFYVSDEYNEHIKHLSPKSFHAIPHEGDITVSLARALADDYLHRDSSSIIGNEIPRNAVTSTRPSRALLAVLQHLEKASLPLMVDGKTCGSWLFDGSGDETESRSLQKAASQHWSLVTSFCQMHQMPQSTKYLSLLAKDNDWVGFLTEAQVGGYPSDMVIHVASKEFGDPRLKIHILTVLKSMSSAKKASSSSKSTSLGGSTQMDFCSENNFMVPVELFGLLAECEEQTNPGEALLVKAKDLRWSLLAIVASCFPDVAPLSCLTVWLEITAARETSSIKVNDIASQIANNVGAAVETTNAIPASSRALVFRYNRRSAKRRRLIESTLENSPLSTSAVVSTTSSFSVTSVSQDNTSEEERRKPDEEEVKVLSDPDGLVSLSKMVRVLCEQRLFLPLLRAFEMFLPSCSLLPFIRALQAFSQMRLSEASAHLASFSYRIREEPLQLKTNIGREGRLGSLWIGTTAVGAAEALLSTCPSAYEKRCLLQLLAATDFGDGGSAATGFRRLYWKVNLAEPSLRKDDDLYLGNETLDDASLLLALEKHGHWDQARNWARQLETTGGLWKAAAHHVTETQAEAMVTEWKEFLWDVPEERAALWSHCQKLFLRYSFPPLQAGLFFLNHAEAVVKDVSARELHDMLLLSLQWLSGTITQSNPVYPLHLLREIETRVWLLAVESEAQVKNEGEFTLSNSSQNLMSGSISNIIERTANIISKMDNHLNARRNRAIERNDTRENYLQALDTNPSATNTKTKRRAKSYMNSRKLPVEAADKNIDPDDGPTSPVDSTTQDESVKAEASVSRWEERLGPEELERAVLSLLEFGQVTAAKQLQYKLSPDQVPSEFSLIDVALKLAAISTPCVSEASISMLDADALSVIRSYGITSDRDSGDPLQALETLATKCTKNGGQGLCERIVAVVKAANILGLSFDEAFGKRPLELLQLLSLKAQDSFEQAKLIVQTHSMPPASIAQILAESFLKGLLAAHRGGYMETQKEEGPAPLLWRISDFLKWAELCPSEPEIGHALMRLVITGQEIPHACEVELIILAHHFYKSSACLDGVDVLVALAATRVECYVSEGDFGCLARLVTGVSNFHALNFILGILIENGQLELLLQKYSAAESATGTAEAVRGFRMAVLTSLKHFNPHDHDACAMVYKHFDMKHETAALLESQAQESIKNWLNRYDTDHNSDLLEAMQYYIKAAEVHTTIDTGNKAHHICSQAFLLTLQIRIPDFPWLNLSSTNARRALVEQSRFQEALIVAEAYNLNQPSEWALVLWNQMLKPELTEEFVAEFVAVLPLQPSMLGDVARFYRAEVAARGGEERNFSVWLSPGGLPAEWLKHLARSFRCLLKRTRDLRLRLQLASVATGFGDVVEACCKGLDRVPETAGPLVLRKGHGGAYLPLM